MAKRRDPTVPRVGPLNSIKGVRLETARLYRSLRARFGHEPTADQARCLRGLLDSLRESLGQELLETRLSRLEREEPSKAASIHSLADLRQDMAERKNEAG